MPFPQNSQNAFRAAVRQWLSDSVVRCFSSSEACTWLIAQSEKIEKLFAQRGFFMAFSACSRHCSTKPLDFEQAVLAEIRLYCPGFSPLGWSELQLARTFLLCHAPAHTPEALLALLNPLAETGDVQEQVAIYGALPLLPFPEQLAARAAEGLRSNITLVFDAIALHNPYPAAYLDETAWNQLVMKALFTERPLYRIYGLSSRRNARLAQTAHDYAHERRAAGRSVPPELWQLCVPYMHETALRAEVVCLLESERATERAAGRLLLTAAEHRFPEASFAGLSKLLRATEVQPDNWFTLGKMCEESLPTSGYQQAGSGRIKPN